MLTLSHTQRTEFCCQGANVNLPVFLNFSLIFYFAALLVYVRKLHFVLQFFDFILFSLVACLL